MMANVAAAAKSILNSKTFWFNALGAVAHYAGILPIPPTALFYTVAGANIGLRLLTKGPVYVVNDAATEP